MDKQTVIYGKKSAKKREIASLTKIMTAFVVLQTCRYKNIDIYTKEIKVSEIASDIRGTSAELQTGDVLTVEQLLYGLMLPSGNDAAFALAQHFGKMLFKQKYHKIKDKITTFQFNYHPYFVKYFIKEMNMYAQEIGLSQTHFDSPHGLQNVENLSTADDVCKLTAEAMKMKAFRDIVGTTQYEGVAKQLV